MRVEAFIIHLPRAVARRAHAESFAASLAFAARIVEAVDGQALTDADVARVYERRLHRPHYPFALRRPEIGAFLSHRRCWQAIVDGGLDAGLVFEDDVESAQPGLLDEALDFALAGLRPMDYVRLPFREGREKWRQVGQSGRLMLVEPELPGLGALGQIVSQAAAAALLAATARFDRPVDTFLQMRWAHDARMLSVYPACLRTIDAALGGSTIQARHDGWARRLSREVQRPLYRAALYRMNRKFRLRAAGPADA